MTPVFRKPRTWTQVWVLCVLVLAMLAPGVSRTLAWAQVGSTIEICTADGGARWVVLPSAATQQDEAPSSLPLPSLDHCPFCLQTADRGAAPPPQQPYLFLVQGGNQERPVWQAFFFASPSRFALRARAPPLQA